MIDLRGLALPPSVVPGVLGRLGAAVGDFVLVGALARDLHVMCGAGMPQARSTHDVDITVFARSTEDLRQRMADLRESGTRHVFYLGSIQVDVLARGPIAPGDTLEVAEGTTCDVTGMEDAASTAQKVRMTDRVSVRIPTLASLVGLKLVAWDVRGDATRKDAQDLAVLLDASHRGVFEARCFEDTPQATRYGFDPHIVGPALLAAELVNTWRPDAATRIRSILDGRRDELLGVTSTFARPTQPLAEQFSAFREQLGG